MAFAYIFEWTPSGFRKTSTVTSEQSVYQSTGKRLNSIIIIGLSLAVVLLLTDRIFNVTGKTYARDIEKSIAVLPFTNMSNDPDQEYFSDGLTDDILTQLAKIEEFRVISRTSVMQYKDNPPPISEIGRKLNVGLILEGSVQKSGNQLRITAQLINAKTDEHIWAESYDRPISDLFHIQREVAMAIADITEAKLSQDDEQEINSDPTNNIEAYQLFQRGKYYLNQPHFSESEWIKAIGYFEDAVNFDPQFAESYGQLAKCHARLYFLKSDHTDERKKLAENAAEKALQTGSNNPNVQLSLGYYHLWAQGDKITALSYFELAADKLDNNVEVLIAKASLYEAKGEWDKYIESYEKGIEISPLDLTCMVNLAFGYYFTQRFDDALVYNTMATNVAPEAAWNHLNQRDEAVAAFGKALEIMEVEIITHQDDHRYHSALGLAHAGLGNKKEAIEAGKKAIEILPLSKDAFYGVSPLLEMALIYDILGESDLAIDHLEKVLSIPNFFTVEWLKRDIRYKNIRSNSRYGDLIAKYTLNT